MKKLFLLLLPLLAAGWCILIGGCNKAAKTTITVQEYGTGKPIPNARVSLGDCDGDVFGSSNCFETSSGITDENGKFKTEVDAFSAGASAEGYWPTGDDLIFIDTKSGVSNIANLIYLYPHAWLEVTVKNESGAYQITVPSENPNGANRKILIGKGAEEKLVLFRKGNTNYSYIFSIQDYPDHFLLDYTNVHVKAENGEDIHVNQTPANWFDIMPQGHQTTKIAITY